MPNWRSIRFRLSVQYSAVVFGLGGALLGLVYLAIQRQLRSETMTRYVWSGQQIRLPGGQLVTLGQLEEIEIRAIESIYNEVVLEEVAKFTLLALIVLFLFSLIVGWVMSGRVLRPVGEITSVAREIQASDLSRRIGLEGPDDELKRLADTFDGMLERLDRAFTSQRQFLADTSHDLRTPLAVIRSNVELVTDDPSTSTEDWQRAGGIIRRNAEKMSVMIDDLLAAARLQAGKAQAVVIDLAHLVEHKAEEFSPLAGEQTVVLETRVVTALVQGVESSLDRALSNLMDNAVKAAPADSTIILGCGTEAGWAWMAVSDQGPGLPPEPADRVGLGLSIVSQIAESHGGSLATHVGPGGSGTVMVIWLPVGESTGRPPEHSPLS